jgi:hypothetical protein
MKSGKIIAFAAPSFFHSQDTSYSARVISRYLSRLLVFRAIIVHREGSIPDTFRFLANVISEWIYRDFHTLGESLE